MKTESTTYECDGPGCKKMVTVVHTHPVFGPSPVATWVLLANNQCFCCMECLVNSFEKGKGKI